MEKFKTVYKDLETGIVYDEKNKADALHKGGHRIRVCRMNCRTKEMIPTCEWIPGSDDYYVFVCGERILHRYNRKDETE